MFLHIFLIQNNAFGDKSIFQFGLSNGINFFLSFPFIFSHVLQHFHGNFFISGHAFNYGGFSCGIFRQQKTRRL